MLYNILERIISEGIESMANNKWRLSDELWGKMAPLIPEHKTQHPLGTHRKRVDNRAAMDSSAARQHKQTEFHRGERHDNGSGR
ncbi:putative transposase of IS4/5 family (DUF4096) [Photorhabdus temperata subsp. temperata Meg1]|uniref:Putative transposase of IS4/5 family (DUF4096) n=2 Tax=Photorhabdus temperata subsp. temperata Meg1 TaxID=1393735 RepID=A0A081RQL6_PHOTE|nr:putative transposase of IS4/5 family (DUF4096) [Photorhabdus temperata subsp. temperata Meg1]